MTGFTVILFFNISEYRFKHGPLDTWSVRERLALASAVRRSGDQNWFVFCHSFFP